MYLVVKKIERTQLISLVFYISDTIISDKVNALQVRRLEASFFPKNFEIMYLQARRKEIDIGPA